MGNCWNFPAKIDDVRTPEVQSGPIEYLDKLTPPPLTHLMSNEKDKTVTLPIPRSESEILSSPYVKALPLSELKNATRNFQHENLIGEGGFGYVYKGWINEKMLIASKPGSGTVVAVKKLKSQGHQGHKEWLSEVKYLGQLHHPNLVKLIGYCLEGDNRLLVYEFMPGGSLENRLFKRGLEPLSWAIRVRVAIGAARGLHFLHNSDPQVIYRDFKSSNILLDSEFNAKVSDFGLAKAGPTGDKSHVTTQVFGTQGYTAPEYISTGRLTSKCDVYSFGVVLLELLTGRRAIDNTKAGYEQKLVEWARPNLDQKLGVFRIMDTKLGGQYPRKAACIAARLAKQCTNPDSKARPRIDEVLAILEELPSARYMYPSSTEQLISHKSPSRSPGNHQCPLHGNSTSESYPLPMPKRSPHG